MKEFGGVLVGVALAAVLSCTCSFAADTVYHVSNFGEGISVIQENISRGITMIAAFYDENNGLVGTRIYDKAHGIDTEESISQYKQMKLYAVAADEQKNAPKETPQPQSTATPVPAKKLEPEVCGFYGNKNAAMSITFDDGDYESAENYNEVLKEFGFRGTAMVIAQKINSGNQQKWKSLLQEGNIDIGNHSYYHKYSYSDKLSQDVLKRDIVDSYTTLKRYFPDQNILTFAAPWGQSSFESIAMIQKNHYANRGVGGAPITGSIPWYGLKSFCYDATQTTLQDMNQWVDDTLAKEGWGIELFHGCSRELTSDKYSIPIYTFRDHLKYMSEHSDELWVCSFTDAVAYIKERQSAEIKIEEEKERSITLTVTDDLPDEQFYYPLTVRLGIPEEWGKEITCQQNGKRTKAAVMTDADGNLYAYVDIIPDGGSAVITP